MYLDSNVLLDQIFNNSGPNRVYSDKALARGGTVSQVALTEITAKMEVEERRHRKNRGETFGPAQQKVFRMEAAGTISTIVEQNSLSYDAPVAFMALQLMRMHGLDYADCLLCALAAEEATQVATSDKELIEVLGAKHWKT